MKKSLLLIFTLCSYVWLQVEAATTNGTIVNGYYIIQDFDGDAPTASTTGSTYLLDTYPVAGQGKSAKLTVNSNNGYFTIPVTLPEGRVLSNNDALVFDLYHHSGTFKRLRVHLGSTHAGSSQVYDFGGNFLGGTTPINRGTISVNVNLLTGYATAGNSFRLGFGIDYGTTVIFVDNIRLSYTLTTPSASAADNISTNSFSANWQALFGVENYRLDVATDASFTSMVSGYNNLNVGNVLTYEVTGLDANTTYYYRVRGAKTGGTSPSSSPVSVLTLTSGPIDPYVMPNLDPVTEIDPTPSTISVPTVFNVDDFESYAIDYSYTKSVTGLSALVKTSPTNPSGKAVLYSVGGSGVSDSYIKKSVTLPAGKFLSDYLSLKFDLYLVSVSYKQLAIWIGGTKVHQEQFNGSNSNLGTKTILFSAFSQSGAATVVANAGDNPEIGIGITDYNNNTSFYIDNVTLNPGAAPTATTATAATHINATSFKAQWSLFQGSTAYFLDVATNNTFTNMVSGYDNLNVGNVSNYVVTGLSANTTYYYRVRGTNTSTQSNTITVTTKAATVAASHFATRASGNISDAAIWQSSLNNSNWTNATAVPTGDAKSIRVLKDHELTLDDHFSAAEIIVRAGGKLNLASGKNLTLSGRLFLESDADGTATFLNNGAVTVTGNATVKQYLTSGRNWYFASPVEAATSNVFKATEGNQLWERNVAGNSWTEITATDAVLTQVKGYVGKVAATGTVSFTGVLNDGVLDYTLNSAVATNGKFHLVGNPYPSYLNWQSVVTANPDVMPTMWFRTKTAANAYLFGTVLMSDGIPIVTAVGANTTVSKFIPPMQAFWVRMNNNVTTTSFTVNNNMRSHADQSGNRFKAPANQTQLLRLEVSNGINSDEAVLYFNTNASDAFDRYDAPKMFNNNVAIPEIFTLAGNERLVISGMNSYNFNTMIPLGFVTGQTNSFSIRASQLQNFDNDTRIVLMDKDNNTEFDLTQGDVYSFSSDATNSDERFAVLFKSASGTTSVDDVSTQNIYLFAQHGLMTLQMNTLPENASVKVYNTTGQMIYSQAINSQSTQINRTFDAGAYLVKVENGSKVVVLSTIIY